MSASYSDIQSQQQARKGLAIASLVLGIISIPTLGVLGVGSITALILGVIALKRIKKEPAIYGGKGMAIAGIITNVSNETFCVHAVRSSANAGSRDFVICEDGFIRFVESRTHTL